MKKDLTRLMDEIDAGKIPKEIEFYSGRKNYIYFDVLKARSQ